jgi:putative spermidine/putrescine transport system substrate-binding protein
MKIRLRIVTVVGLGMFIALVLLAVGHNAVAKDKPFEGVTLRVGTWGGSWLKRIKGTVGIELEKRGAKIEYVIGNPGDNLAKLIAARGQTPPFDVMEFSENNRTDMLQSGFLAKLNYDNIPNAKGLDPRFRLPTVVAHSFSVDGIAYNTEKFKALGLPKPDRFAVLSDPKLKGKVAWPQIFIVHGFKALIGISYENGGSIENIEPGLEAIKNLDIRNFFRSSTNNFVKFKAGDVLASPWHAGWVVRARRAGVPLAMAYPNIAGKRGVISAVCLGRIKGAREPAAAEFFINAYLSPPAQEAVGRLTGVRPVIDQAAQKLKDDPLIDELLPLDPSEFKNVYHMDWNKINIPEWTEKWNRAIVR